MKLSFLYCLGYGALDNVQLGTAHHSPSGNEATWIEMCTCPEGYVGQFCESCGPGYRHDPPGGGKFARCVPCNCNGHAEYCDPETGFSLLSLFIYFNSPNWFK